MTTDTTCDSLCPHCVRNNSSLVVSVSPHSTRTDTKIHPSGDYLQEQAAIGGHPDARHNLGIDEWNNRRFERARKHFIIAANLGLNDSLKFIRGLYADGHASKEDYANALRAYHSAVDETKSEEREVVEEAIKKGEVLFC